MAKNGLVYLYVWSGDAQRARDLVSSRYPGIEIREFPHRRLRESRFMERVRLLRGFRGRALVFYFQTLSDQKYRQILECIHFLHRCRESVFCDSGGCWESRRTIQILGSAPGVFFNILLDMNILLFWWWYLQFLLVRTLPASGQPSSGELAYLIPSPADLGFQGGAISHIRGFLYALKAGGETCRVFSGTALAQDAFENEIVAAPKRRYFFWEAALLSYNFLFVRGVEEHLATAVPRAFYQRHCRFSIAGALLARRFQAPLILEYNGPEVWIADHWDPTTFRSWVKLCEELTLRSAARILVVSEVLRDGLIERGIPPDRIRVNPNGVDPDYFCPGRGREGGRSELGVEPDDVLVGFVGSFSLWHGIEILQQAIVRLLRTRPPRRLRFVLMGHGLLQEEMRSALAAYERSGEVIFTGLLPRDKVAQYLDASDILVSPHIPMPDGSRFFGSPTKIFEYMAMSKGIVASRLDQLAEVLEHNQTALLVTPGNAEELAEAILCLALDPKKRQALGLAARRAAVERHCWSHNVACALSGLSARTGNSLERPLLTLPRSRGTPE